MAPLIPSAKSTLSYPLYACDFDPVDSSRLVVGGGGGAGRTGVGNKITLLDTSNPNELVEVGEIDLSKEEDNVTSLARIWTKGRISISGVVGIEPVKKGKGKGKATAAVAATKQTIRGIKEFTVYKGRKGSISKSDQIIKALSWTATMGCDCDRTRQGLRNTREEWYWQILRLPPSGKGQCRIAQSHRLPSSITKATGLAVSNLTPPVTPDAEQSYTQFVIAVAGHDISISFFKVDLQHELDNYLVTPIKAFRTFKKCPPTPDHRHHIFNFSHHPPILSRQALLRNTSNSQVVMEIRGIVKPHLDAANYLSVPLQEMVGKPFTFPSNYLALSKHISIGTSTSTSSTPDFFASLRSSASNSNSPPRHIYVHHGPPIPDIETQETSPEITSPELSSSIKAALHDENIHPKGKSWDELTAPQKENWKKKLKDAGHWVEEMGETIFKGVIFGELGGLVGAAVVDAAR
ncbi:hypothetical protein DID88_008219 [Monilinia fructigena]|uniref:Guanine nucleotide-exchange factor SEC12 n=1 Tax=Monilinia fructigena TaxID=38457 RepID=A0A395J5R4_9HELO|nr:hypothetical protein DID88_008219 [Monilinia fructigena]